LSAFPIASIFAITIGEWKTPGFVITAAFRSAGTIGAPFWRHSDQWTSIVKSFVAEKTPETALARNPARFLSL
jgi:hypothetical protein